MIKIADNRIICMNAGDYLTMPIFINVGTAQNPIRYILQEGDRLLVSIMEPNQPFDCGVVRQILTAETATFDENNDPILELNMNDTINLHSGMYYYEVKLVITKDEKEYLTTVLPKTKFYIL